MVICFTLILMKANVVEGGTTSATFSIHFLSSLQHQTSVAMDCLCKIRVKLENVVYYLCHIALNRKLSYKFE